MGTRATINIKNKDGSVDSIFNHWDGYIDGLGNILYQYYLSESKVRELSNLGDVSSVGIVTEASPFTQHFGDDPINSPRMTKMMNLLRSSGDASKDSQDMNTAKAIFDSVIKTELYFTTAYHRDRNEEKHIRHVKDIYDIPEREYNYLFIPDGTGHGRWLVNAEDDGDYKDLSLYM